MYTRGCLVLTARMWECKHVGRCKQVPLTANFQAIINGAENNFALAA